jgi:hypothetical protein
VEDRSETNDGNRGLQSVLDLEITDAASSFGSCCDKLIFQLWKTEIYVVHLNKLISTGRNFTIKRMSTNNSKEKTTQNQKPQYTKSHSNKRKIFL